MTQPRVHLPFILRRQPMRIERRKPHGTAQDLQEIAAPGAVREGVGRGGARDEGFVSLISNLIK